MTPPDEEYFFKIAKVFFITTPNVTPTKSSNTKMPDNRLTIRHLYFYKLLLLWSRRESNPNQTFRKRLFYPLNYETNHISTKI